MSKVIFVGSDRSIFDEGSQARLRMIEYGRLFDELHVVIFAKRNLSLNQKLAPNVFVYPTKSWCKIFYIFDAYRIIRKIIGDMKVFNSSEWVVSTQDPFEAGLVGNWVVSKTGIKFHVQIHTDFLSPFFCKQSILNWLRLKIAKTVLFKADGVRVVSERIRESLEANFNLLRSGKNFKVSVLPIFVEQKDYTKIFPYEFKKEKPDWSFVMLSVARLEPEKNISLAIKSLNLVCKKYPHVGYAILGDGGERKKLEKLVKELKLSDKVKFFGHRTDLEKFYNGANLFLNTSNFEGFGMTLVEASFANLPILTTNVGAVGWLFKDGEDVLVCEVGDQICFARKIIEFIEDNSLQTKLKVSLPLSLKGKIAMNKEDYLNKFKASIECVFN
jgi:glycosyltransferase involved in cell wall biosynthesis